MSRLCRLRRARSISACAPDLRSAELVDSSLVSACDREDSARSWTLGVGSVDPPQRDQGLLAGTWMQRGDLIQQRADLRIPGSAECHGQLMRDSIAPCHQSRRSAFEAPVGLPHGCVVRPIELPCKAEEFERTNNDGSSFDFNDDKDIRMMSSRRSWNQDAFHDTK